MEAVREAGSFRDPSGFVFRREGALYRQVNDRYRSHYDLLLASGLYDELTREGLMVPHEEVPLELAPEPGAYRVLRPEPLPCISYPYEWCFSQFKHAALVTLEIQRRAVNKGLILKDANAFNIQFRGTRALLIDTLSFEKYEEGAPWIAYRQFCEHFLAPVELMSRVEVRLSQMFRSFLDGIPLDLASRLLPLGSWFRFGSLLHIHLHARSIRKFSDTKMGKRPHSGRIRRAGLMGLLDSLESSFRRRNWNPDTTEWAGYELDHQYGPAGLASKKEAVSQFLERMRPEVVWDLGANTGTFSAIAAEHARHVVALDSDPGAVEKHFRDLHQSPAESILPLIVDLTNPTPGLGWSGEERKSLEERGPADLLLALALVHHLSISGNLPFERLAEGLASLGRSLIIEFVPKSDPQVQRLLRSRSDVFDDYTEDGFQAAFSRFFSTEARHGLPDTERTLYLMVRKEAPSDRYVSPSQEG